MRGRQTRHRTPSGAVRTRRTLAIGAMTLLIAGLTAPSASAGELSIDGAVLTWDANAFVPPEPGAGRCSPFTMSWANNTGRALLQIGVTITNDGSATWTPSNSVYFPWPPIGAKAGTNGVYDRLNDICSVRLTNGLGPYTVVFTIEDYDGRKQTVTAPITFLAEPPAVPATPAPAASSPSASEETGEQGTRPARPRSVKVAVTGTAVRVSWRAPGDLPSRTEFVATARPGGKRCVTTESTCTITGLQRGTRYRVQVVTRNANGASAAARSRSVLIPTIAAPAPRPAPAPAPPQKPQHEIR